MQKSKIHYEARLNSNKSRMSYGKRINYKKGTVISTYTETQFKKITVENIDKYDSLSICTGFGSYEYFDLEKDIEFVKVETKIVTKIKTVKLKP